jgi:hypothetical protein
MNLILDIWFFFSLIQELHDGGETVPISWFKSLAVMQNESSVPDVGSQSLVDIGFTDCAVINALKN